MSPLPAAARAVADALTAAVSAAGDAHAFSAATADLVALDGEQLRRLLGTVVRLLLEESHPAGVDGDALRTTLSSVVTSTPWHDTDPSTTAYVLLAALGLTDDDQPPPPVPALLSHAALVIATLLPLSPRPLPPVLTDAFADLSRAETLDYPT